MPTTKHFRKKYHGGHTILNTIRQAPGKLAGALGRTDEKVQQDLLKRWFSIPIDTPSTGTGPGPSPDTGPGPTPPPPPPLPNETKDLETSQISGGFKVSRHPKAAKTPVSFILRAAYEALRGNPWKKHHPADFDFHHTGKNGGLKLDVSGVTVEVLDNNTLRATITAEEFSLELRGFDAHRDLITDIRPEYSRNTKTEGSGEK